MFSHLSSEPNKPQRKKAHLYDKLRKEEPAEVEYHSLAPSNGIAGFLQHRLRFREVSMVGAIRAVGARGEDEVIHVPRDAHEAGPFIRKGIGMPLDRSENPVDDATGKAEASLTR